MTKHSVQPTTGQLERELSQKILALYRNHLKHQPSRVTCQLFDNKLTVIIEDAVTQPEKLLNHSGENALVEKVRLRLDEIIQPLLQQSIEDTLQVSVVDILSDVTIDTGRGGMILILEQAPNVRSASAEGQ